MIGSELLKVLSYANGYPLALKDIVSVIEISLVSQGQVYSDFESMRISVVKTLTSLRKKGLVTKTRDGKFSRYLITNSGLLVLSELELSEDIRRTVLARKLDKERSSFYVK